MRIGLRKTAMRAITLSIIIRNPFVEPPESMLRRIQKLLIATKNEASNINCIPIFLHMMDLSVRKNVFLLNI